MDYLVEIRLKTLVLDISYFVLWIIGCAHLGVAILTVRITSHIVDDVMEAPYIRCLGIPSWNFRESPIVCTATCALICRFQRYGRLELYALRRSAGRPDLETIANLGLLY